MPLTDIGFDVIHCILTNIPDYSTLFAAVRTRPFHDVYQMHPASIVRAVARNVVGPAFSSAMNLCAYTLSDQTNVPDKETSSDDWPLHVDLRTIKVLKGNVQAVQVWENLFSLIYKDKRSATSTLSHTESLRFQRAIYRSWLCALYIDRHISSLKKEHVNPVVPSDLGNNFLEMFPTNELLEVITVLRFMREVQIWMQKQPLEPVFRRLTPDISNSYSVLIRQYIITLGVHFYLGQAWIQNGVHPLLNLERLWHKRGLCWPAQMEQIGAAIIGEAVGREDTCDRCQASAGLHLWGSTKWGFLDGHFDQDAWSRTLPGRLSDNVGEAARLWDHMQFYGASVYIEQMFDLETDATVDSYVWDKSGWYCTQCMLEFIGTHVIQWAMGEIVDTRDKCRYGYDCPEQAESLETLLHWFLYNHSCKPVEEWIDPKE